MFRWAKLAENAGFGFDKMLAWKHKVEFETHIDYSDVTFFLDEKRNGDVAETENNTENNTENLSKSQKVILKEIRKNPYITSDALAGVVGITADNVRVNISKLKSRGFLVRVGPDKGGYWKIVE